MENLNQPDCFKPQHGELLSSGIKSDGPIAYFVCLYLIIIRGALSFRLQHILVLITMAIGSMALAATFFAGDGALNLLWADLDRLMGNKVIIYPDPGPGYILLKLRPSAELTRSDLEYVRQQLSDARYVAPRYFGRDFVSSEFAGRIMPIDGISPIQEKETTFRPISGRTFSPAAHQGLILECLITESAANFFKNRLLTKMSIRIGSYRFQVVGIIEDPPEVDERYKPRVVIPYFSTQQLYGKSEEIKTIVASWKRPDKMESFIKQLKKALDECRAPNAYLLSSSDFKIKKRKNIVSNFMVFGITQSVFCILVASIGVVNVMLSNVIRRTKEFAIRITMGARQKDIMIIVLAESFMLGVLGAVIGILMAVMTAGPLCQFISTKIPEASHLQPYIGIKGVIAPIIVCGLSGLVAGLIPALKAGRLDILGVLKSE